jgi:superfamily I DNA and/or RNA helicase
LEGEEELINQLHPKLPLPSEYAEKVQATVQLSSKDKELLYGSLYIIGSNLADSSAGRICTPLLLFPCDIAQEGDHHYVSLKSARPRINESAFALLKQSFNKSSLLDLTEVGKSPVNFGQVASICKTIANWITEVDTTQAMLFPQLWKESKLRRKLQPKQREKIPTYELIPASAIFVSSQSSETYGILSELSELEKTDSYSPALQSVFTTSQPLFSQVDELFLPSILNESQTKAVHNAHTHNASLIIGPPGTGKSFTIANIAIDHYMRGESVLITSKQDEAVDIISEKVKELIGSDEILIRGGAKSNRWKMTKQLRKQLNMRFTNEFDKVKRYERKFEQITQRISLLENEIEERFQQEIQWSRDLTGKGFSSSLKSLFIKVAHNWHSPHWHLLADLNGAIDEKTALSKKLLPLKHNKAIWDALYLRRNVLERLYQSMTSHQTNQWEELQNDLDYTQLLKTFPIWLTKLTDCYRILPLQKELFDVVIIDESSQCDMASVLPVIQRAKRVVVVGDPNQLRHVSFLSKGKQFQLATKLDLPSTIATEYDYRNISFLDQLSKNITSQEQVTFLNEHYRSYPSIIQFSNKQFYSEALRLMKHESIDSQFSGNVLHQIRGKRSRQGVNQEEAEAMIQLLKQLVRNYAEFEKTTCPSIGILSPFRDQVNHISKCISQQFSITQLERHKLSVGTPYTFQGEERDIMLISFAVDDDSHPAAFSYLNKADVFNVGITRAKTAQHIFYSFDPSLVDNQHLVTLYINDIEVNKPLQIETGKANHEAFINEVIAFIKNMNLKSWVNYDIAGLRLDIMVKSSNRLLGIDLIGFPGEYEEALSVQRYKILSRAGVSIFPLSYSYWTLQTEETKRELKAYLSS